MTALYNLQLSGNTPLEGILSFWSVISYKKTTPSSTHENLAIEIQEEYKSGAISPFTAQTNIIKILKTDDASTAISWNPPHQIRQMIKKINVDLTNSRGLIKEEIDIAILFNLIDSNQDYFWTEEWQKGYREAQKDIEEGNYEIFKNINDLLDYLHR